MKTLLYDKTSVQSVTALLGVHFKKVFTRLTNYDIMPEASRKDNDYGEGK